MALKYTNLFCSNLHKRSIYNARSYYMYSPEPFHPIPDKQPQFMTAAEAVSHITSGNLEKTKTFFNLKKKIKYFCILILLYSYLITKLLYKSY